ncbi:hypothetical protein Vau01_082720 [Virgisporangium aurantiacum]|uniref:Uncharacterized protein n=1 Tax=Virgisporangium aurantiacum TaxID=175570 RepID=A0A8J3ZFQ7_9ACTN|nr:hypothetical protein Vau01_082720 [Virgisporangium aurantiacum]
MTPVGSATVCAGVALGGAEALGETDATNGDADAAVEAADAVSSVSSAPQPAIPPAMPPATSDKIARAVAIRITATPLQRRGHALESYTPVSVTNCPPP